MSNRYAIIYSRAIRYKLHAGFRAALTADPDDRNARAIAADHVEENGQEADAETLHHLRHSTTPLKIVDAAGGKVWARPLLTAADLPAGSPKGHLEQGPAGVFLASTAADSRGRVRSHLHEFDGKQLHHIATVPEGADAEAAAAELANPSGEDAEEPEMGDPDLRLPPRQLTLLVAEAARHQSRLRKLVARQRAAAAPTPVRSRSRGRSR